MNSTERKEIRYKRRKEKRLNKIIDRSNKYTDLNKCFVFNKVLYYSNKCCNGVRWKRSTKIFLLHQFTIVATTCYNIKNNSYKLNSVYRFTINERGKSRNITAPHIKDRLVHKVISNEILIPIYEPNLIYDNGASVKNKGFLFALKRIKKKLLTYINKDYNGYVILIDYKKFFPNCSHEVIHSIHKKYIRNEYTIKVIEDYLFIEDGISLGVEIAQKEASIMPNILDKYVIDNCFFIERYMDDTFILIDSYENANKLLNEYKNISNSLKINISDNKTKIIPFTKFKYCKWKFFINNKKVIMIPDKKTIYRQRKKLRRMINIRIDYNEIKTTKMCYKAYLNYGNSYKYIKYLNNCI